MIEFLQLPKDVRLQLIAQVNARTGMSLKAIEKDWWVTLVLKALFSLPMREHFIFKGGTSLSKAWKLIERFSEDIDIALAPEAFGREYRSTPSNSYVKTLKKEGCLYTSTVIKDALYAELVAIGVPTDLFTIEAEAVNPLMRDKDPQSLYVRYSSLYDLNEYIAEAVKVEFGVRGLKEPFAEVNIQSILAEELNSPAYSEKPFAISAVDPRKTFMEKLLLLHEKFATGHVDGLAGERQSRHLSDLEQMMQKGIVQQVLHDSELYTVLLEHRRQYVRLKNVDYETMQLAGLWFLPPQPLMDPFRRDYEVMRSEMIYGSSPDFDTLIDQLRELNLALVAHGRSRKMEEVIERAKKQLKEMGGNELQTTVVFVADPELPIGHANTAENYIVEFIKQKDVIIFHRIKLVNVPNAG